jgi:16S rRNA A1518/A1519 N6-dimethyltransferase RsmA/KsgA/DIM1 with predicted DNA glycosylase/AP lyase activity
MNTPLIQEGNEWLKSGYFKNLPGGCHGMEIKCLIDIYNEINISEGDQVWEIGLGYPRNAILLYLQSRIPVIATETSKLNASYLN